MNIKSLLLGSAAAAVAVSAHAADAIVIAEPEPMEYVRICDTYGTGYFYIPGTENCLKIGGYVRYQITHTETAAGNSEMTKLARLATTFDVRNSTEWGTLRSYGEVEFNWNATSAQATYLRAAFIDIGDQNFLRIGKTWNGLRSWVPTASTINDQQIGANVYDRGQITYVFNGTNGTGIGGGLGFSGFISAVADDNVGYDPIFEGGVGYGWGPRANTNFARIAAGYDASYGSTMVRAGVDVALGSIATAKLSVHHVNDDAGYYRNALRSGTTGTGSNWAVIGGLDIAASKQVAINLAAGWYDEGLNNGAIREWEVSAGVNWQPVAGLQIRPEITYISNRTTDDSWAANLRFQRNF
jgi:hypothetical protein